MPKGLKFALSILAFPFAIPLITVVITLKKKPLYHTEQPLFQDTSAFAQFTWQEKPTQNLEHLLFFLEKPEIYTAQDTLHIQAPVDSKGYHILPRGAFHDEQAMLQPVKKMMRRKGGYNVLVWIIQDGKAFPLELDEKQQEELQAVVPQLNQPDKAISAKELGEILEKLSCWEEIKAKLKKFREDLKNGKIDLTPRKRVSQFMPV